MGIGVLDYGHRSSRRIWRERVVGDFTFLLRMTDKHKFNLDGLRNRLAVIQDSISEIVSGSWWDLTTHDVRGHVLIRLLSVSVDYYMYFVFQLSKHLCKFLVSLVVGNASSYGRYLGAVRSISWSKSRLHGHYFIQVCHCWLHLLLLTHYEYVWWSSVPDCRVYSINGRLFKITGTLLLVWNSRHVYCPRGSMSMSAVAILFMIGGIQPNPGPQDCLLDRSTASQSANKGAIIQVIITSNNLSVLAVSET